jgi:ATP-dependent DNA ligase
MLARLQSMLPRRDHWRYEPKFDGFRGLLWRRSQASVQLLSRNVRELTPWFPEIVQAAHVLPAGTWLDGEIVIADEQGRSDFGALQQRMSVAKRASAAAALDRPAVLLVFDLLRLGDTDLTGTPLRERREALEHLVTGVHPCLQLVQQTANLAEAEAWLALLPIEGVVAKRVDGCLSAGPAQRMGQGQAAKNCRLRRNRDYRRSTRSCIGARPQARGRPATPFRTPWGCHLSSSVDAAQSRSVG